MVTEYTCNYTCWGGNKCAVIKTCQSVYGETGFWYWSWCMHWRTTHIHIVLSPKFIPVVIIQASVQPTPTNIFQIRTKWSANKGVTSDNSSEDTTTYSKHSRDKTNCHIPRAIVIFILILLGIISIAAIVAVSVILGTKDPGGNFLFKFASHNHSSIS